MASNENYTRRTLLTYSGLGVTGAATTKINQNSQSRCNSVNGDTDIAIYLSPKYSENLGSPQKLGEALETIVERELSDLGLETQYGGIIDKEMTWFENTSHHDREINSLSPRGRMSNILIGENPSNHQTGISEIDNSNQGKLKGVAELRPSCLEPYANSSNACAVYNLKPQHLEKQDPIKRYKFKDGQLEELNSSNGRKTLLHEIGHNLGLQHQGQPQYNQTHHTLTVPVMQTPKNIQRHVQNNFEEQEGLQILHKTSFTDSELKSIKEKL